ncbi:MAG: DNA cytosine methyltransferase [Bacteroidota bacterium]
MPKKSTYIDLFAGCGGLSLGLYNTTRWKGHFAIEKSPDAFKTLHHNLLKRKRHFNWPDWLPKEPHDINQIIKKYPQELRGLRGKVDLVAGGPPCQGFSTAGKRKESDARNRLIISYIKFIRLVQPSIIFFENVKGFTQQFDKNKIRGRIYSEYVKNQLSTSSPTEGYIGYDVYGELVNFADFGIPQKRTRFILVGIRKDLIVDKRPEDFFLLIRKNKASFLEKKGLKEASTLEDAISDLLKDQTINSTEFKGFQMGLYGDSTTSYQNLMRAGKNGVPDSHRFVNHSPATIKKLEYILEFAPRNKSISKVIKERFGIKKHTIIPLASNLPAPTITTLPDDYVHYCEPRIFTVREYARIQSFNDWYEFKGRYTTGGRKRTQEVPRYSQIGNAIPPLFGEQSGVVLKKLLA